MTTSARADADVEISVFAVLTIGVAARFLHQIAFADLAPGAPRASGYLATAAYLVAAGAILLWSVRRWANRRRAASLITLLLIADAALTAQIIEQLF